MKRRCRHPKVRPKPKESQVGAETCFDGQWAETSLRRQGSGAPAPETRAIPSAPSQIRRHHTAGDHMIERACTSNRGSRRMARARYTFNIQADWERFLRWEK